MKKTLTYLLLLLYISSIDARTIFQKRKYTNFKRGNKTIRFAKPKVNKKTKVEFTKQETSISEIDFEFKNEIVNNDSTIAQESNLPDLQDVKPIIKNNFKNRLSNQKLRPELTAMDNSNNIKKTESLSNDNKIYKSVYARVNEYSIDITDTLLVILAILSFLIFIGTLILFYVAFPLNITLAIVTMVFLIVLIICLISLQIDFGFINFYIIGAFSFLTGLFPLFYILLGVNAAMLYLYIITIPLLLLVIGLISAMRH